MILNALLQNTLQNYDSDPLQLILFLSQWVNDVVVCKEDLEVTFHEHLTLWWLLGFLVLDRPTFISLQIDDEYTFSGPSQLP